MARDVHVDDDYHPQTCRCIVAWRVVVVVVVGDCINSTYDSKSSTCRWWLLSTCCMLDWRAT